MPAGPSDFATTAILIIKFHTAENRAYTSGTSVRECRCGRAFGWTRRSGKSSVELAVLIAGITIPLISAGLLLSSRIAPLGEKLSLGNMLVPLPEEGASSQTSAIAKNSHPAVSPSDQGDRNIVAGSNRIVEEHWGPILVGFVLLLAIIGVVAFQFRTKKTTQADLEQNDLQDPQLPDPVFQKRQVLMRILTKEAKSVVANDLRVAHLMTKNPATTNPQVPLDVVARTMKENRIRHIIVVDSNNHLCGIISNRDLRKSKALYAADVMTTKPISVQANAPLQPAITQLIQHRISCLPVLHGDIVVGVLTTTDLSIALQCTLNLLSHMSQSQAPQKAARTISGSVPRSSPTGPMPNKSI